MAEQITTAAELDALPVGVVLLDCRQFPVWRETHFGWRTANGGTRVGSDLVILDGAPLTVLYRPDAKHVPVKPSREDVARALAHVNGDWIDEYARDDETGEEHEHSLACANWEPYLCDVDTVLDLLPGRSVAEVKAEALEEAADSPAVWGVLANSLHVSGVRSWLRHRAAALLRGESHV